MQEIDAIHFTVPAVARRDGSLDYPAMFVPCSSTTGSSKQSGTSLMIDLLQEFLPILVRYDKSVNIYFILYKFTL